MICITSFYKDHWDIYAKDFLNTWTKFWPTTAKLVVYGQEVYDLMQPYLEDSRITYIDLGTNPRLKSFESIVNSKISNADGKLKNKLLKARRWCYKVFTISDFIYNNQEQFAWLDSDTFTLKPVPKDWFTILLDDSDIAVHVEPLFDSLHWETGLFVLGGEYEQRIQVADSILEIYESGDIFEREKTWDGLVWPEVCKHMTLNDLNKDIPVNPRTGKKHGLFQNKNVRPYMRHLPGDRKFEAFENVNRRSGRFSS